MQDLVQVRESLVSARAEIHLHAVDDGLERFSRQPELTDEWGQSLPLGRFGRPPVEEGGYFTTPLRQLLLRRGSLRLIGRVVDRSTEIPDRDDGATLLWRQDQERVVEVGVS